MLLISIFIFLEDGQKTKNLLKCLFKTKLIISKLTNINFNGFVTDYYLICYQKAYICTIFEQNFFFHDCML